MGTKNNSPGSQHTSKGVTQGISLVASNGLPIGYIVDGDGKIRLLVDANVTIGSATVNVDLDASTDNVAIRNTSNSNELLINGDGSIDVNVSVNAADGDSILISDGTDTLLINPDGSLNAVISATNLDIRAITHLSDSIKIGDGLEFLLINPDGSINIGNTITVQATDLDIRNISHASDSIKIGDGTDFLLINPDGSINVGNTVSIQATDLDIRNLDAAQDNIAISDGTNTLTIHPDGSTDVNILNSSLPVEDVPNQVGVNTTLSLTTTAIEGKVGISTLANRKYIEMQALTNNIQWGYDSTCPFSLFKNQFFALPAGTVCKIYLKTSSGVGSVVFSEK